MPDYGHDLEFGVFLPPAADQAADTLRLAHDADRFGLDLVSVQDHPYQGSFLDAWTLLSVIAATTSTVRLFPNVANLPLRPPAVLARAAASLPSQGYAPPEQLAGMNRIIDAAAEEAGRSPKDIRRLYNFNGRPGNGFPGAAQLADLALDSGISGFVLAELDHLERFAKEVAPEVRELVAKERVQ
jgi:CO/xanthine dehydrogenase Mo-binding subunit